MIYITATVELPPVLRDDMPQDHLRGMQRTLRILIEQVMKRRGDRARVVVLISCAGQPVRVEADDHRDTWAGLSVLKGGLVKARHEIEWIIADFITRSEKYNMNPANFEKDSDYMVRLEKVLGE